MILEILWLYLSNLFFVANFCSYSLSVKCNFTKKKITNPILNSFQIFDFHLQCCNFHFFLNTEFVWSRFELGTYRLPIYTLFEFGKTQKMRNAKKAIIFRFALALALDSAHFRTLSKFKLQNRLKMEYF